MRSTLISVLLAAGVVAASFSAASCSSSSSQATGDGGNSSSSSSSGGSSSGGDDGGIPCTAYVSDADLTSPTISFKNDVLPLFEHSCGLSSSCHYDPMVVHNLGIFLGCDITFDAGAGSVNSCAVANPGPEVYADLVGGGDAGGDGGPLVPLEITGMPYVTPGDPTKSYIMHKLDGDMCTLTGCNSMNMAVLFQQDPPGSLGPGNPPNWCGTSMPLNAELLPAGPACGGSQDCTGAASYARDTVRAWIAQGALNN
jgi:hypothetical protein